MNYWRNEVTDRATDWLTVWLIDWLTDWLTDRLIDWPATDRPTDELDTIQSFVAYAVEMNLAGNLVERECSTILTLYFCIFLLRATSSPESSF